MVSPLGHSSCYYGVVDTCIGFGGGFLQAANPETGLRIDRICEK